MSNMGKMGETTAAEGFSAFSDNMDDEYVMEMRAAYTAFALTKIKENLDVFIDFEINAEEDRCLSLEAFMDHLSETYQDADFIFPEKDAWVQTAFENSYADITDRGKIERRGI